jgi:hypothetical protein
VGLGIELNLWLSAVVTILTSLVSRGIGDYFVNILCNRRRLNMEAAMGACLMVTAANAALAATLHIAVGNRFATGLAL